MNSSGEAAVANIDVPPSIYVEEVRKSSRNLSENSRPMDRELNLESSNIKTRIVTIEFRRSRVILPTHFNSLIPLTAQVEIRFTKQ